MSGLFSSPKAPPPPPAPPPPAPLPDPDDERKKALAARKVAQGASGRGGFQDTVLSQTLG